MHTYIYILQCSIQINQKYLSNWLYYRQLIINSMHPSNRHSFITPQSNEISSFHRKNKKQLLQFLKTSFGFSHSLSSLIIAIHDCYDMAELMSLFVLDDDNHYGHIFVPDNQDTAHAKCRICQSLRNYHLNEITWEELVKFETELGNDDIFSQQEEKIHAQSFTFHNHYQNKSLVDKTESNQSLYQDNLPFNPNIYPKSQSISCTICYGNFLQQQMLHISSTVHQVCQTCISEYLKQQILNLRIQNLRCPHCPTPLSPQTIKQHINNTLWQKYQTFNHNLQIQKNPNFKWCPNPKCSVVISINKNKHKSVIKCPKCSTAVCTKCNRQAHQGLSCDDVLRNVFKGLENASDIQKCKKCKALVEKISGCNHMTCGVCRYQWCWLCGATYSDVHFSPLNPLGCAGLQNRNISSFAKCKIYILRVLMIIGFLILLPIVAPFVMVFCGPVIFYNFLVKKMCRYYGCCFHFSMILLSLPVGLIIDPFIWIGAIVYFIPGLCKAVGNWYQRRRNIIQGSQNQIKRKLLEEGDTVVVEG